MRMYKTDFIFHRAGYMQHSQIQIGNDMITVGAGNDDDVQVYRDKHNIYVLTENQRFDYIGLERFNRETLDSEFDIFMQEECDDKEWLLNISRVPTKIKFLLQWDM